MKTCLLTLHKKLFSMPWAALAVIAAGVGAIVGALLIEHFFGAHPCILCIYQRVPYTLAALLALVALALRKNARAVSVIFGLIALAYFVNVGIAFYHTGVELHWWDMPGGCAVNPAVLADPESARLALLMTAVAECDKINFTFLGFTLANWNILICLGLGAFAALVALGPCTKWACACDKKSGCC